MTMRVLIVCDWYLKYSARQVIALRAAGVDAALLCRDHAFEFNRSVSERRSLIDEVRKAGVAVFELRGRVSDVRAVPSFVATTRRVRAWRPQIVHAHENHDPRLLALTHGYRCVVTVHDIRPHLGALNLRGIHALTWNAWLRRADRLVVHGQKLREELAETIGPTRIAVIPHGLEPLRAPLPLPLQSAVLLFGRLEPYKGIATLFEAMEHVWKNRRDVRLIVAGQGPEATRVPNDSRAETIASYIPEEQVDALLGRASLVVLPYLVGSQSGVGSLALSRGVPVVVTAVGSLPELALDPGFIVPPGNPEALAEAILACLDHPQSLRTEVLEHARRSFSWSVAAQKSFELYDAVLKEG
jgi:glycosyltransferase involved in cell wall biosynthesis